MHNSGHFLIWAGPSVVAAMFFLAAVAVTLDGDRETLHFARSARVALYKPNHFVPYFYPAPELIY